MNEFVEYLKNHFDQSDLSHEEFNIFSKFHLRFELGDGLKNRSKERVDQSTYRAKTLFEEFFKADDDAWLLVKSFRYKSDISNFFSPTAGYLQSQIKNFSSLNKFEREKTIEEFDEALNDDGVIEMTDFTTTHIQEVVCQSVGDIAYENIFRGIANLEMGFDPSIGEAIYIINRKTNVAFYMYDDRGCLVFSNSREALKPIYDKYNDWLVEYHRKTFDRLFS
jgi:hypothetical protein